MVSVHSGGGTYFHRALINGLEPGTHYHYQIRSIKGTPYSKVSHFDTAPDSEVDFKFLSGQIAKVITEEHGLLILSTHDQHDETHG